MATKFSLLILNLLFISLIFSPCLASAASSRGFGGGVKNKNGNPLNMLKAAKPFLKAFTGDRGNQTNSADNGDQQSSGGSESSGVYTISYAIGTPPQNVTAVIDITTNFVWTQCQTCDECITQSTPMYNPALSSTYTNYSGLRCADNPNLNQSSVCKARKPNKCRTSCYYTAEYDDDKNSSGILGIETITFGSSPPVPDIVFGCALETYGDYENSSGVFSLGRGPYSFISQLGYQRFSYCLSSDQTKESPLNFGSFAKIERSGQSTRLIEVDAYPKLYYIDLVDITVGGTLLNIPNSSFAIDEDGEGGVYLETAVPVTYLETAAYNLVEKAFISQMHGTIVNGSDLDLNLCFNNSTKPDWPSLKLHFAGNATLELKMLNYMIRDPDTGIECLTILPVKGYSLLGSFIQMDTNFVYDMENSTISFEKCGTESSFAMSHIPQLVTTMLFFLLCMLKLF